MMNKLIYVAPREKRQRGRGPFRLYTAEGEAALLAGVIGVSVNDYVCGDDRAHDDARFYFMSDEYQSHLQLLGLPDDMMPAELRDRVIFL